MFKAQKTLHSLNVVHSSFAKDEKWFQVSLLVVKLNTRHFVYTPSKAQVA